jgi:hypothetical protein
MRNASKDKKSTYCIKDCVAILFIIVGILIIFSGCSSDSRPNKTHQILKLDSNPIQFQIDQVEELTLSKFDPVTGDQWLAVFKKTGQQWKISSPPSNQTVSDPYADETFINHLIDTFRSLRITENAPKGSLASFQLSPPRFGIQLKTKENFFEFKIGAKIDQHPESYLILGDSDVYIASGSTLRMLDLIQDFSALRKKTWTTLIPDDVDQIELKRNHKVFFYAQREGSLWTSRTHQKLKSDLNSLIQKATRTPTIGFIDHEDTANKIRNVIAKKPLLEIVLYPRKGPSTLLQLGKYQNAIYGLNSARPQAVLTFDSKLIESLDLDSKQLLLLTHQRESYAQ